MSFDIDVESMNSTASHVSTSVENTADNASAPSQTGSCVIRKVGRTRFSLLMSGSAARAAMPKITGRNANNNRAIAFRPTPILSERSDLAPYAFWIRPGDTMNDGPSSSKQVHPESGPDE